MFNYTILKKDILRISWIRTKKLDLLVEIAKAISDSNRVRALMALRSGELCVCQLIELLKLAPSTVSKHMSILKQAGLVESRKDSRWVYYRLPKQDESIFVDKVIELMCNTIEYDKRIISDKNEISQIQKTLLIRFVKQKMMANHSKGYVDE